MLVLIATLYIHWKYFYRFIKLAYSRCIFDSFSYINTASYTEKPLTAVQFLCNLLNKSAGN